MRVGGARHEGCCVVRLARWPQDRDGDHGWEMNPPWDIGVYKDAVAAPEVGPEALAR